ncbi:signal transduction histidine kinase [Anaerobacterium chartisolvens]|uniref:histidine kinase n=1 Tax=Anaerobacterium chartisolvens TaxID=1297424 RepID=A0A369BHR3_9FIRM|nr:HAMP domain-containing sensor histidine kinase [Anaerobacterium chartisolvens]RCX21100.1 signal transduction histidine kinase [Anaerobacterium chartisolvens]
MKRKLSNQFLGNFLVIFLLTILATVLAFVLLSFASGLISDSLAKNRYPASAIIKEDYKQIDASAVVENGGGVQVVDKEYRVVYSSGLNTIGKDKLSTEEFTTFLAESKSKPYHYEILYQPEGEFWLIVTFPTSIRLDFSLVYNKKASSNDFMRAGWAMATVVLIYLLILALFTFIYSRITAAGITVPLQKLCDGTRLLREGDYSTRVDLCLKNEFAELQNTFNDMATRIEHEISLRKKSEEDRRRLILDISHDLKNPMSSIQGYVELLMTKSDMTEQEHSEHLEIILNNSKRANRLLTELFELSQMDSPEFSLKPVRTDLCEYLRQICGELVPQLERAGFGYEFDIPEESAFALLDTDRFGRIIQNLMGNAVRYNPQETTVTVSLTAQNHQAVIDFSDDGIGIPAHLAQDIFKPFVRADDSRNSKTGGSGLGLSIAKKIAEAHGGDLTLRYDGNKGSTFRITIPTI